MTGGARLEGVAQLLRAARHVVVLTGAGVSAESGLPTFREAQTGLWSRYRPEDLATPEAFARDPQLVWEWYAWRRSLVARAAPNAAHYALVRLEQCVPHMTLVTQNVDGLHRRAGSRTVHELHGDVQRTICSRERIPVDTWPEDDIVPPPCPSCRAPLRPDVVWFGEPLPAAALHAASAAAARCALLLVIGTSLHVYPAASLVPLALDANADIVIIDPAPPRLPAQDRIHVLAGAAAVLVPALVEAAWPEAAPGGAQA